MNDFESLFQEPTAWVDSLPKYQKDIVSQLLSSGKTPEEAAEAWLSATPQDTYPFGAERGRKLYLEMVVNELEAFICGAPKYNNDRSKFNKLLKESGTVHAYCVGGISVAIAPVVGTSGAVLAPVIALVLMSMGKITINAWCNMRKELKETAKNS